MMFEEDFGNLSGLDDFDIDALEDFMKDSMPVQPNQPLATPTATIANLPVQMSKACAPKAKRGPNAHLANIPGNKRSFRDYTKPIKRGFMNRQIPPNDIRRYLGQIIIRACNESNHEALLDVLNNFCGPAVVLTSRFIGDAKTLPIQNAVLHRELHGVSHIANYLSALFEVVPDGLVQLLDTKVHMFQNGCSYIVGKFTFKGHKCYDLVTLGDVREKRMVPSKFDRRNAAMNGSKAGSSSMSSLSNSSESQQDFSFDQSSASGSLSDLEFLFDDDEGDDVFAQPSSSFKQEATSTEGPQSTSVALEHMPVEFIVSHPSLFVEEVPLSFLGTIAFYLDPDAKIFKVEVLSAMETSSNTAHSGPQHKKARRN